LLQPAAFVSPYMFYVIKHTVYFLYDEGSYSRISTYTTVFFPSSYVWNSPSASSPSAPSASAVKISTTYTVLWRKAGIEPKERVQKDPIRGYFPSSVYTVYQCILTLPPLTLFSSRDPSSLYPTTIRIPHTYSTYTIEVLVLFYSYTQRCIRVFT
jgi:hypothetical protein